MKVKYKVGKGKAVLAGAISIPDFWGKKDDYFAHTFNKPPKDWIDPAKEATATKTALQTGQKTFKQIAAENGSDWRKQVDDICEVLLYAKEKHGVDLGGVILGQKKADGLYEGEDDPPPPGGDAPGENGGHTQGGAASGQDGGPAAGDGGGSEPSEGGDSKDE